MNARAVLRLVRLPNTLTAAADVLAGAAIAGHDPLSAPALLAAAGSMAIYGGGVALNDVLDAAKDRALHPERPIPSGAVPRSAAAALAGLLLALGGATAFTGGPAHLGVTAGLILAVLAYDALPDRLRWTGVLVMGACRALNLLRGATLGGIDDAVPVALASAGHLWFVGGITLVSTFEDRPAAGRGYRTAVALLLVPALLPVVAAVLDGGAGARGFAVLAGAGVLMAGIRGVAPDPEPGRIVARAVFSLPLLDALWAVARGRWLAAAVIAALFPVSRLVARLVRQRGS